jgi:arylsulfatase A-like enzyme
MSEAGRTRRRIGIFAVGVLALTLLTLFFQATGPGSWDRRPRGSAADIAALAERDDLNVLFIVIDTLRAERLGSYGYERDTSPALDRLAGAGARFAHHLAQSSWTKASMASLWTGLYPARTGILRYDDIVPAEARMPAEILREAGFQTVGLYRNGWVAPTFGFDQGFEIYQHPTGRPLPPAVRMANPTLSDRGTDEGLVEQSIEFLRTSGQERWFLYLHMMDLHEYLYDADSAIFGSSYSDVYDNSIRWTDGVVEALLWSLAEMGFLDRTLIAITSDHGEAFLERGYEGHAREVYRESTEVPFFISFPFRLDPGVVVDARTRNVDVWPTLLDLLGLEAPGSLDGRSLVPEILAAAEGRRPGPAERTAIAHLDKTWGQRHMDPSQTIAVTEGSLRYVRSESPDGPVEQLFDASDDPSETRDLATEQPETVERMAAEAEAYSEEEPVWGEPPTRELDEMELKLLRALGYAIP